MVPAAILGRNPKYVGIAEALVMAAMLMIVGALIIYGGVEGTGLFWVYTAPFLAFFLKGQRLGWWYSFGLMVIIAAYFLGANVLFPHAHQYSGVVISQFIISLGFYSLIAAAFNHLRSRFEDQLQKQVAIKTADATQLLNQLQFNATHDTLTKLPNKILLLDILQEQMNEITSGEQVLVVCNLHLERMFEMGNILGIGGADDLALKITGYLERFIEHKGTLAHTRRDEFIITYHTKRALFNQEGLRNFIAERQITIEVQGYSLYCEFTLGLALYPDHANDPISLLNKAEQAMLQAQKNGLQWSVYDQKREQAFVRHHLLFGKLREALMQQHLRVHYQPQIDLKTGAIVGAEALLRWHDPNEGFISPLEFIPVSEESGLIRPLTTWLVGVCMRECDAWHKQDININVSINLSAMNLLDPDLINVLMESLSKTNLAASCINLEITESCFMSSPERALEVIQRLHDSGFTLSIDDFGTGYSSLSYLKNLPINELKIDQSFVRKLLQNSGDQAIVSSTIDLAHNFGLTVVAEGIEDEPTSQWLQARGCDIGQGYFFAKPMASDLFLKFALINLVEKNTS
jgi:diguanylate cyclase (GGDEF)-like protein